jgi:hypothetical protein
MKKKNPSSRVSQESEGLRALALSLVKLQTEGEGHTRVLKTLEILKSIKPAEGLESAAAKRSDRMLLAELDKVFNSDPEWKDSSEKYNKSRRKKREEIKKKFEEGRYSSRGFASFSLEDWYYVFSDSYLLEKIIFELEADICYFLIYIFTQGKEDNDNDFPENYVDWVFSVLSSKVALSRALKILKACPGDQRPVNEERRKEIEKKLDEGIETLEDKDWYCVFTDVRLLDLIG